MLSACASATERAAIVLPSKSKPPTRSFNVTNSSAVIAPVTNALNPYWMPELSRVFSARMIVVPEASVAGTPPQIAMALSTSEQRGPEGLVAGSYTCAGSSRQLFTGVVPDVMTPVAFTVRVT